MNDPRLTPDQNQITEQTQCRITMGCVDLCRMPGWPRDRQVLFGATVTRFSETNGWAYVQSQKDNYVGHVAADALGTPRQPTHRVVQAATTLYDEPDLKSGDRMGLSHGSLLTVTGTHGAFLETPDGFAPNQHLAPIDTAHSDPATVAELYLGTPYLWGGNSRWGIDCSGLVQAALLACAIPCPGDSDQQQSLGSPASGPYKRNDLLFWKGHVALVVNTDTLIHANAHSMSVTYEPISAAIRRIKGQGDGPVTAHRRT